MKVIKHIIIVCVCLVVILGMPFLYLYKRAGGNDTDAVSSASVIIDQPSGEYVVLINKNRRKDDDTLRTWISFFSGDEISFVFEDIICHVAESDTSGYTMAASFQSRLPENQMKVVSEDGTLMMSKAENGNYDIIVMSKEAADIYNIDRLAGRSDCEVCSITGVVE